MRIQTNPREKGHLQSNNFIFFHLLSHWQGIKPPPTGWFQFEFYQVPVKCLLLPLKDCSCCSSRHPCSDKNDAAKVGCCFWDGHKVPDGHPGAATASCHSFSPLTFCSILSHTAGTGRNSLSTSKALIFPFSAVHFLSPKGSASHGS